MMSSLGYKKGGRRCDNRDSGVENLHVAPPPPYCFGFSVLFLDLGHFDTDTHFLSSESCAGTLCYHPFLLTLIFSFTDSSPDMLDIYSILGLLSDMLLIPLYYSVYPIIHIPIPTIPQTMHYITTPYAHSMPYITIPTLFPK